MSKAWRESPEGREKPEILRFVESDPAAEGCGIYHWADQVGIEHGGRERNTGKGTRDSQR